MRPVGILGGMGPEATILLMQRVLAAVPAADDQDHVPLIVHQNPQVPSRIAALIDRTGESPGPTLALMARDLEAAGAAALAMPCNTAHAWATEIRAATPLPFLDMVEATASRLAEAAPGGRVGLLASPATRIAKVYAPALARHGLAPAWPADEAPVLALIRAVKRGRTGAAEAQALAALAASLEVDALCIACTELSLLTGALAGALAGAVPVIDSLDALAVEIVAFATTPAIA